MNRVLLFILLFTSVQFFAQHQEKVDFLDAKVLIVPDAELNQIWGSVTYEFEVLENVNSVFLDAKNMEFSSVLLNSKKVPHSIDKKRVTVSKRFKKGKYYKITLEYTVKPKQTVYFLGWDDEIEGNEQIWTQGQGKYTSHWLPSFDDMKEKVEFDLSITFDKEYTVISNGKLIEKESQEPDALMWSYDMQEPMSSYLLAFAIGNYKKQEVTSASGIPIENYYYPQDSLKVEPTYRYTKQIFDFLEEEIGVPYPWQNYKQIPVHDFLYAGMENTTATIFSDGYVIDSTAFVDKNYVNVNAHEMAHQWFGNLVTEKDGNHHWLHEGFATYYAHLLEQHLFGEDHFYWIFFQTLQQLQAQGERGEGQSLLDPKASSLTFYEKGAWALVMLKEQIGDEAFKKGIQSYLKKYQFKNVTITDFLNEMETASAQDLSDFRKEWLESAEIPYEEARNQLIENSASIRLLSEMEAELKNAQSDNIDYQKYWDATSSVHLKKHLLENYERVILFDGMRKAFESDTIPIRQSVLKGTPFDNFRAKEYLLALLKDNSYSTKEMALLQLWLGYPEERSKYLNETSEVIGLPNKNVRLLWLTLAVLNTNYNHNSTSDYVNELTEYTSAVHSWEIRMGAFQYLHEALGLSNQALKNLFEATGHHSWQFKKYARSLVDELIMDSDYLIQIRKISKELNEENLRYLRTKIKVE